MHEQQINELKQQTHPRLLQKNENGSTDLDRPDPWVGGQGIAAKILLVACVVELEKRKGDVGNN
eukprot:9445537-Ditylum_brightwellii.AAC.1